MTSQEDLISALQLVCKDWTVARKSSNVAIACNFMQLRLQDTVFYKPQIRYTMNEKKDGLRDSTLADVISTL